MREYKADIFIDVDDLHNEWLYQPALFMYYGERHSDAVEIRDLHKHKLDVLEAQLILKYKRDWSTYSEDKMTDSGVKAFVAQDPEYSAQAKEVIQANHAVNICAKAVSAFDQRKRALENLVSLNNAGFHAPPSVKKQTRRGIFDEESVIKEREELTKEKEKEDAKNSQITHKATRLKAKIGTKKKFKKI